MPFLSKIQGEWEYLAAVLGKWLVLFYVENILDMVAACVTFIGDNRAH
jgi:hypothetical protein